MQDAGTNAPKTRTTVDNLSFGHQRGPLDSESIEEQQVGVSPEPDGLLRGARLEHYNSRVNAAGCFLPLPGHRVLLRDLETGV